MTFDRTQRRLMITIIILWLIVIALTIFGLGLYVGSLS